MNPLQNYEFGKTRFTKTYSTSITGTIKYLGGTVAQNGSIYYAPGGATRVMKFDPVTKISTLIGATYTSTGTHKWSRGVLYSDGKIYCLPQSTNTVLDILVIDPTTDTTSLINIGQYGMGAAVLGNDGFIYGPPLINGQVYKFNPITSTGAFIGTNYGGSTGNWYSGVLGTNNKIYFTPANAAQVLELDVTTGTTTLIGTNYGAALSKWASGTLGLNGKIYFMPYNATQFIQLDTTTLTTTLVGTVYSGSSKWITSGMGINGKIYGMPFTAEKVVEFDTNTLTTQLIGANYTTTIGKWAGANLVSGEIYGGMYGSNLMFNIFDINKTNLVGTDANIPSPISGIATSNYNKYFNKF